MPAGHSVDNDAFVAVSVIVIFKTLSWRMHNAEAEVFLQEKIALRFHSQGRVEWPYHRPISCNSKRIVKVGVIPAARSAVLPTGYS